MRIEKLEFNKIKVTLFEKDLQMFNINISNIKPNSPEIYSFLSEVMKRVSTETDFNPYEGQVIVEATPSDDSLVLTVYKNDNDLHKITQKRNIKHVKAVKKVRDDGFAAFESENFEDMCGLLKHCSKSIDEHAKLYKMGKVFCFVTLEKNSDLLMKEFAKKVKCSAKYRCFLKEHATLIANGEKLLNIIEFLNT